MTRFAAGPSVSAFFADSPQYGVISDKLMQSKSQQRQAATQAESFVERAGLDSMARIRTAEAQARATIAGAAGDASATRSQGMGSMFGSIAGGIGSMDFGGPPAPAPSNIGSSLNVGYGDLSNPSYLQMSDQVPSGFGFSN